MSFFRSTFTTEKIDDRTTLIIEKLFGAPCYMYLLEGEDRAALIDTGMGGGDLQSVVRNLTSKELIVLNTHGHFDHCGANNQFGEAYIDEKDLPVLKLQQSKQYFDAILPLPLRLLLSRVLRRILYCSHDETYRFFSDGDTFDLGGRTIEVLSAPGHSIGSVCFLDRENRYLFSGDTVVSVGVLLNLCGSTNAETFLQSQQKLRARSSEWEKIFAGHNAYPLDSKTIDQYITCTERILDQSGERKPNRKKGYVVSYEDIRIEMPTDARVLEIPPAGTLPFIEGPLI
ncbi:MAG: MBL fold metallo-hydrolase [Clostridiales Family XIII bacterium]|nr:MBL fold metallo-hydrolase [Clostridiales Family XIII bacterium]